MGIRNILEEKLDILVCAFYPDDYRIADRSTDSIKQKAIKNAQEYCDKLDNWRRTLKAVSESEHVVLIGEIGWRSENREILENPDNRYNLKEEYLEAFQTFWLNLSSCCRRRQIQINFWNIIDVKRFPADHSKPDRVFDRFNGYSLLKSKNGRTSRNYTNLWEDLEVIAEEAPIPSTTAEANSKSNNNERQESDIEVQVPLLIVPVTADNSTNQDTSDKEKTSLLKVSNESANGNYTFKFEDSEVTEQATVSSTTEINLNNNSNTNETQKPDIENEMENSTNQYPLDKGNTTLHPLSGLAVAFIVLGALMVISLCAAPVYCIYDKKFKNCPCTTRVTFHTKANKVLSSEVNEPGKMDFQNKTIHQSNVRY